MNALLIMILSFAGYLIMYNLYGRYIGKKIFNLTQMAGVPAVEMEDGVDYVPTKKEGISKIKLAGLFCNHKVPEEFYQGAEVLEHTCRILMELPYCDQPLVGLDPLTRFTKQPGINIAEKLKKSFILRPSQCPDRS